VGRRIRAVEVQFDTREPGCGDLGEHRIEGDVGWYGPGVHGDSHGDTSRMCASWRKNVFLYLFS
jgi:hypothetical protein